MFLWRHNTLYPANPAHTGVFKIIVESAPYIKQPIEGSLCSGEQNTTTEGVILYKGSLNSNIRHFKVLSIVLGILTFVFAATSFLLAAMQIGN